MTTIGCILANGGKPLRETNAINSGHYVYLATLMQRISAAHLLRSDIYKT